MTDTSEPGPPSLVEDRPEVVASMRRQVKAFVDSCRASHHGADYPEPYQPVNAFQELRDRLPPKGS